VAAGSFRTVTSYSNFVTVLYYLYKAVRIASLTMEGLTSATSTVTPELAAAIQAATAALPAAHLAEPIAGESFETPEQALLRLQD